MLGLRDPIGRFASSTLEDLQVILGNVLRVSGISNPLYRIVRQHDVTKAAMGQPGSLGDRRPMSSTVVL